MGYKPDVVQKATFEYSPLGQVFNKGLDASEKQEGLLKRLKNIEYKTDDFASFSSLRELFKATYYRELLIPSAEREQNAFNDELKNLERYRPRNSDFKNDKENLLINAQNFYDGRKMIIRAFQDKIFPLKNPADYPNYVSEKDTLTSSSDLSRCSSNLSTSSSPKDAIAASSKSSPDLSESICPRSSSDLSKISDNEESKKDKAFVSKPKKLAIDLDKVLDPELVDKYFYETSLKEIVKQLKDIRRQDNKLTEYINKKALLVVGLLRLENDIKNMSEDEVKNKKLDLRKNIVRKIVDALQKLKPEEVEKRQQGKGLKILTPQQIITRLPILLAQLNAGNNSQKLKNVIRQLPYSLYRSKNLSKTIYNIFMNTI